MSIFSCFETFADFNCAGNAENLGIAGAAWIVGGLLSQNRSGLDGCLLRIC